MVAVHEPLITGASFVVERGLLGMWASVAEAGGLSRAALRL